MNKIASINPSSPRVADASISRGPWLLFDKTNKVVPSAVIHKTVGNKPLAQEKNKLSGLTAPTIVDASKGAARVDAVKNILGHISAGEVHLRIPLQPDAKLSVMRTRPNTYVDIRVVIVPTADGTRGEIDIDKTRLEIRQPTANGESVLSSLDGPLCLNPHAVFINKRGKLKVVSKGLPNIGITKLATGTRRLPKTLDELFCVLQQRDAHSKPSKSRKPISLAQFIDIDKIRIDGFVSLTGAVNLGGNTVLDLQRSKVELTGTPSHLRAKVSGEVRSATFHTKAARVQLGAGHIGAELEVNTTGSGPSFAVSVNEVDVGTMSLQAGPDKTTLNLANPSMTSDAGRPLLSVAGGPNPKLAVSLDSDLDAIATLPGQSGQTLSTILGTDGDLFQVRVMLDSDSQKLQLETRIRTGVVIDNTAIENLNGMRVDLDSTAVVELQQEGNNLVGRGQVAVSAADIRVSYGPNGPELSDIEPAANLSDLEVKDQVIMRERRSPTSDLSLRPLDPAALERLHQKVEPHPEDTFAMKFPGLTNRLEELIGAVGSGSVQVTVPLREFHIDETVFEKDFTRRAKVFGKVIEDRMGIEIQTKADYASGKVAFDLVFEDGKLVPGKTSVRFEPPVTLTADIAHWWPGPIDGSTQVTATIDSLVLLQTKEDGQGMFWPNITFDGKIPQALMAISQATTRNPFALDHLAKWASIRKLTQLLFSQKTIPLDVDDFVASLSLEERLERATPKERVRKIVDWKCASIHVSGFELDNRSIPLGNGQFIDIAKGSRLKVSGSDNNLFIEGTVQIAGARLGDDELAMSLRGVSARLRLHKTLDPITGEATMSVELDGANIDKLEIEELSGDTCASLQELTNASLRFNRVGDGKPELSLSTDHARMAIGGAWKGESLTTEATHVEATVAGTLTLEDGALDCVFERFDLDGQLGVLTSDSDAPHRSKFTISGATHCIVKGNEIELRKLDNNDVPLIIENIELTMPNGSFFQGKNGTGHRLKMTTTAPFQFALWGMDGEINLLTEVGHDPAEDASPLLDLRHAKMHMAKTAALRVDNGEFYTQGALEVHDLDASVSHIAASTSTASSANIHQIDVKGSASITMSKAQDVRIDALNDSGLAAEITTDLRVVANDPSLGLDLRNLRGEARLMGLHVPADGPLGLQLRDVRVSGEFESGSVFFGGDKAERTFQIAPKQPGKIQMQFPTLATGMPFTAGTFDATGTIELQTSIREDVTNDTYTGCVAADLRLRADIETHNGQTSAGIILSGHGTADLNIAHQLKQPIKMLSLTSK